MSLLTAVQQAVYEIGTGTVPTAIIGNTDAQVAQLLAFAKREGRDYHDRGMQWGGWPEVRKQYTFSLVPVGTYTGNTTNGSLVLTNMSSTAGLAAPSTTAVYGLNGPGILAGATVTAVNPGVSVTLDTPANSTASNQSFIFGQVAYPLPSDFKFFLSGTFWDRNFRWQMLGPLSGQEWQTITSGISPVGPRLRFRIMNSKGAMLMWIQPCPGATQTDTIAFEYISNAYCQSSGGTAQTDWANDSDTYFWDEDLLTLGLIWRFKRAKGLDYGEERQMYDDRVEQQMARSGGNRSLPLNASASGIRLLSDQNVPDTGFGT